MIIDSTTTDSYISTNGATSTEVHDFIAKGSSSEVITATLGPTAVGGRISEMYVGTTPTETGAGQSISVDGLGGYPYLMIAPNFANEIMYGCVAPSIGPGIRNGERDTLGAPTLRKRLITLTYTGLTPTETCEILGFIEDRKGDLERFWVPSWTHDFPGVTSVTMYQRQFEIGAGAVSTVNQPRMVYVVNLDTNEVLVTECLVTEGGAVTLTNALPFSSSKILMGYMYLMRLSDSVAHISFEGYGVGDITLDLEEEIGLIYSTEEPILTPDRVNLTSALGGGLTVG